MLPTMSLYRHPEIQTGRPFDFDIDDDGWLWEACGPAQLYAHRLATGAGRLIDIPEPRGKFINHILAFQGKIVGVVPHITELLIFDPATSGRTYLPLPGDPIVWYARKLPDGRLALFDRNEGHVILLDDTASQPRAVRCPYPGSPISGHIASGQVLSDGLLYMFVSDPARIIRFDPQAERFVDCLPFAIPDAAPGGFFDDGRVMYISDTAGGRLLPFDFQTERWLEPLPIPGYRTQFGFCGACIKFQGQGYYSLSTYRFPSRIAAGNRDELILPEGWDKGVDGRPPRFLDRQLVFDPASQSFDFLTVPAQPDGVPLICYGWADDKRLIFTGYVIPFAEDGGPSDRPGDWLIWQSMPVK